MPTGPTRRSHVVRIYGKDSNGDKDKSSYVDVEVLDAVAFRDKRGEEMILSCDAKKADPFIQDDVGAGKQRSGRTRRSHVEKLEAKGDAADKDAELYVEVIDCIAFRDKRGEEWILNSKTGVSPFDVTDGTSDGLPTRRAHDEKYGTDAKDKHPKKYLTVQRSDMLAFRNKRGEELVVKIPSFDDGNGDRAKTFITPQDYDPVKYGDDKAPPENSDPNFYVEFLKNKSPLLGDTKIKQGPLWWIRKVQTGQPVIVVEFFYKARNNGSMPPTPVPSLNTPAIANRDIFGDVTFPLQSGEQAVQIVEPPSGAMMDALNQWTPRSADEIDRTEGGGINKFYLVTDGFIFTPTNFSLPYPGTDNCGAPLTNAGAHGGTFFNCNITALAAATAAGFPAGPLIAPGNDLAHIQYYVDALNAISADFLGGQSFSVFELDLPNTAATATKMGRAFFELNANSFQQFADKNGNWTFTIDMPAVNLPNGAGSYTVAAATFKPANGTPVTADFAPLRFDANGNPITPTDDILASGGSVGGDMKKSGIITGTVDKDGFVTLSIEESGGGGGGPS